MAEGDAAASSGEGSQRDGMEEGMPSTAGQALAPAEEEEARKMSFMERVTLDQALQLLDEAELVSLGAVALPCRLPF